MRPSILSAPRPKLTRFVVALGVLGGLLTSMPAYAQLSRVGPSTAAYYPGSVMRGTDTAYDPVNDVFLLVMAYGPVYGVFVSGATGAAVTPGFTIADGSLGFSSFPAVEYSPQANKGQGGFLVVWHAGNAPPNHIYGRMVAYAGAGLAGQLITSPATISGGDQGGSFWENIPSIAYSRTSQRFLVAWTTVQWGIQGRFVDTNGSLLNSVMQFENTGGSRDPSVAWNSATDEFGLIYTGWTSTSALASFRRIGAAGTISARTSFGFSKVTFATGIDVNSANQYVMTWALGPGTMSTVFDSAGTQLTSPTLVSSRIGFDQALGLAYNATTGTLLAVSHDLLSEEAAAVEINADGQPRTSAMVATNGATPKKGGSYYPRTTSRAGTNEWGVVYSRDFHGATHQLVASSATGSSPASGAGIGSTPTPSTPAPTTPTAPSTGCSTPDPFAAIGGGTCVNGGWRPSGSTGSSTGSTGGSTGSTGGSTGSTGGSTGGSSTGCSTPNPFASLGTGTCVNGGWVMSGSSSGGSSSGGSSTGCSTPNPFASLGTGTCVNGGWVMSGSSSGGSSSGCVGADPFTAIGGGVCVSGGWVPKGR